MGLTIHYRLRMNGNTSESRVRRTLNLLRDHALTLGMKEVSAVRAFTAGQCDFEKLRDESHEDHEWFWFMIQAVSRDPADQVIGFRTWPGGGCEEANFGLVRLKGKKAWNWRSFCKTQYASDPEEGGVRNFLLCHLMVVSLLDKAKELKVLGSVSDEGGYWKGRNVEALAREVGEWDEMIAAFAGQFKDRFNIEAPILQRQDFEHLEAKGVDKFGKIVFPE